jgi:hypothetical protein
MAQHPADRLRRVELAFVAAVPDRAPLLAREEEIERLRLRQIADLDRAERCRAIAPPGREEQVAVAFTQ